MPPDGSCRTSFGLEELRRHSVGWLNYFGPHLSSGVGAGPMAAMTGAVALLEAVATSAHAAAASHHAGHSPGGGDECQPMSSWLLVDERQRDRATRVNQRVVAGTRRAGLEATVDRTALRSAESSVESVGGQSDRNRLMRTRMSGLSRRSLGGGGWCGGREVDPPGYPIGPHDSHQPILQM